MINPLLKKFLFSLGTGLVGLALFALLVIYPLISKIVIASQEYLTNQEILVKLDKKESLLKELEKEYQDKQADLSVAEEAFLSKEEAVVFISTLETIAAQTGNIFEIKSASPSLPADEKEPFLVFHISLWGGFSSLLQFLASLENSPYPPYRLTEINSLNIKRIKGPRIVDDFTLEEGDLETVLSIKIYTQ